MASLKKVGLKNIHPRVYKTVSGNSTIQLSAEQDFDGHIWVQVADLVFTTQPRGDGLWDKFWNYWDGSFIPIHAPDFRKLHQRDDENQ